MKIAIAYFVFLAFTIGHAEAAQRQDPKQIRAAVERFLTEQAQGLPGTVSVTVGAVDARLPLAPCSQLQTFLPPGGRAWGNTTVGVRCAADRSWTVYVPARVTVTSPYLIAARGLAPGSALSAKDFSLRSGDLAELPGGVLTDAAQASGKILAYRVGAGQPLRLDMLRAPLIVQNGQSVALVTQGSGFRVSSVGLAIGSAAQGDMVQVRTPGGGVVSGVVREDAVVEVLR